MAITDKVEIIDYSKLYRDSAFFQWYRLGRVGMKQLTFHLEPDERNKTPGYQTLSKWKKEENWVERADEMDENASIQIQKKLIDDKRKMLEKHIEISEDMQNQALEYLETHGLDTAHQAIRLLELGIKVEKESVGLPSLLKEVSELEDSDLTSRIAKLLEGAEIDLDEIEVDLEELPEDVGTESTE